jgi:Beta-lactamase
VAKLAELELRAPPGARASYSQAGYNLAGRILEKVTGLTYEWAVASLIFQPLGLSHSFFAAGDAMTRRFVVGHNLGEDGTWSIARLWKHWRGNNPGAGLASSVTDQLRWARFLSVTAARRAVSVCCPLRCCTRRRHRSTAPNRAQAQHWRQRLNLWALCCAVVLEPSRAARGQLNLRRAQHAYDRGNSRRKLRGIGDSRLSWPLDQYRGRRVGPLD